LHIDAQTVRPTQPDAGASPARPLELNAKAFGAKGDNVNDDTSAIQSAINAAQDRGGGLVFFPPGRYKTTATLRISVGELGLVGAGGSSVIAPVGNFDTFVYQSLKPATEIYRNRLSDLVIEERGKTGGRLLVGEYVAQFISERLVGVDGWSGMSFNNFGGVSLFHVRLTGYRGGAGAHYVRLTGGVGGTGRSDAAFIMRGIFGGPTSPGMRGLDIDGFVHTVNGWACHFIGLGGEALHTRNTVGAPNIPSFITMDDFEADFPEREGVRLDVGERIFFNNMQIHGSKSRAGIQIAAAVRSCSFTGGFVSGCQKSGIAIGGRDVAVTGVNIIFNSSNEFGGALGVHPGILIGKTSRGTVVTGCRSGYAEHPDYQRSGCQIDAGADDFIVVGNNFRNNRTPGVSNDAGTGDTKLVANNI
jgi:pectate lyase-like protein